MYIKPAFKEKVTSLCSLSPDDLALLRVFMEPFDQLMAIASNGHELI